jgi:hypothetical protein
LTRPRIDAWLSALQDPRRRIFLDLEGQVGIVLNHANIHWTVAFVDKMGVIHHYDPLGAIYRKKSAVEKLLQFVLTFNYLPCLSRFCFTVELRRL